MLLTPDNATLLGEGLDHPECVCVAADGTVYAGGEAGQIYRLAEGRQQVLGSTGGFILGLALDGRGGVHACDLAQQAVFHLASDGQLTLRSRGASGHPLQVPNYAVFDDAGNLYVSDSGEYWDARGTGRIFKIAPDNSTTLFHAGPFRFANGLAIDATGGWLYVAQSTASNIARVPLGAPDGPLEVTHKLPAGAVPDGLAFAADGRLVIGCYKPDAVFLGEPDGAVRPLCEDPTGELLSRPTNVALHAGKLYIANLGGWHLTVVETPLRPAPLRRPFLPIPNP